MLVDAGGGVGLFDGWTWTYAAKGQTGTYSGRGEVGEANGREDGCEMHHVGYFER